MDSLAPYEKRVIELIRNGKDKRARKLAKKRVCAYSLPLYFIDWGSINTEAYSSEPSAVPRPRSTTSTESSLSPGELLAINKHHSVNKKRNLFACLASSP